jgi:hypothetical protein
MSAVRDDKESIAAAARDDNTSHTDSQPGATSAQREGAIVAATDPPLPYDDDAPPLPDEPLPDEADDGWDPQWDGTAMAWYFVNRRTGVSQWENPRVPAAPAYSHGSYDRFANFYHFVCPFLA